MPHLFFFFFNDTATTEIYTLSLHDALPISFSDAVRKMDPKARLIATGGDPDVFHDWNSAQLANPPGTFNYLSTHFVVTTDRKSTRLNSSHGYISYAVFCLKKKKI